METTQLFNASINPTDRLLALVAALKGQKQAVVESEIKVRAFQRELTKVSLITKDGGVQQKQFLQTQIAQMKGLHEGTSAAIEVTRDMIFELYEANKGDQKFIAEWTKHWKADEKPT